jgi:hypothetical protein
VTRESFIKLLQDSLRQLFAQARAADEFAFLFSILGINSGEEDMGWQPIGETQQLVRDMLRLLNSPLYDEASLRLALLLYCHITEADYHYHCIYNLLQTIDGQAPKVFNFLDKHQAGRPPSVPAKLASIRLLAEKHSLKELLSVFDKIIRPDIRNAFFHSDYILFEGKLRLKHRGSQISEIPFSEITALAGKTVDYFQGTLLALEEARRSFPKGHQIANRRSQDGRNLCPIQVLFDEAGSANGFSATRPGPFW